MKLKNAWFTLTIGCLACGGEEGLSRDASQAVTMSPFAKSQALVATVPVPAALQLESWNGRTPFYPSNTSRATTLIYQSPNSSSRFVAYGVDTVRGVICFQIEGPLTEVHGLFGLELEKELGTLALVPGRSLYFGSTTANQGPILPPRPGPRGSDTGSLLMTVARNVEGALSN